MTKLCPGCNQELPLDRFGITGRPRKDGTRQRRSLCRTCYSQRIQNDPDRLARKRERNRKAMAAKRAATRQVKPPRPRKTKMTTQGAGFPRRAYVLELKIGADTRQDLVDALNQLAYEVAADKLTEGVSGGYSSGWVYRLDVDETITHRGYMDALNLWLEKDREE